MKIDTGLGSSAGDADVAARLAEELGYDGAFGAEVAHDPFLPLAIAAKATGLKVDSISRCSKSSSIASDVQGRPWNTDAMATASSLVR